MPEHQFANYDEFFAFYLQHHSDPANRFLHAVGTLGALVIAVAAIAARAPLWALAVLPAGYAPAWVGHFLIEGNTPATFGHPGWSLLSNFHMVALMLTGRLGPRLQRKSPNLEL